MVVPINLESYRYWRASLSVVLDVSVRAKQWSNSHTDPKQKHTWHGCSHPDPRGRDSRLIRDRPPNGGVNESTLTLVQRSEENPFSDRVERHASRVRLWLVRLKTPPAPDKPQNGCRETRLGVPGMKGERLKC